MLMFRRERGAWRKFFAVCVKDRFTVDSINHNHDDAQYYVASKVITSSGNNKNNLEQWTNQEYEEDPQ